MCNASHYCIVCITVIDASNNKISVDTQILKSFAFSNLFKKCYLLMDGLCLLNKHNMFQYWNLYTL